MPAYKRTDPGKLAREREAIRKSKEAMKPSPFSGAGRAIESVGQYLHGKIQSNRKRKELAEDVGGPFGPPPRLKGAKVTGFKKRRYESA